MKASIVIPCFNELTTVEKLLLEVQSSSVKDKEVIIVDDGSNDKRREILEMTFHSSID